MFSFTRFQNSFGYFQIFPGDDVVNKNSEVEIPTLLKLYLGEMIGLKVIGKKIHKDPRTFKQKITSLGIVIPQPGSVWTKAKKHITGQYFAPISKLKMEIITGLMLGDAQLRVQTKTDIHKRQLKPKEYTRIISQMKQIQKKAKNEEKLSQQDISKWNLGIKLLSEINTANLRIHKSILEIQWVKVLMKQFQEFIKIKPYVKRNKTQSTKWSCGFDTSASVQFFHLWQSWYKTEKKKLKKILPNIRKITPNILLHWYVGDGYSVGNELALCTQNFNFNEQKYLIELLHAEGITAKLRKKRTNYYIGLSATKENKKHFFEYIEQAKLYKEAEKYLPYKFLNGITKKEWLIEIKKEHPEYFQENQSIRETLLKNLTSK